MCEPSALRAVGSPAVGAAVFIREAGAAPGALCARVGVEALQGQDPVPLPAVQFIYANPFFLCLRVCEHAVPAQAFVDLLRQVLFHLGDRAEASGGGVLGAGLALSFVRLAPWPGAMISAGT